MMEEILTDLAVIGSGPSGQKAAIQGAKLDLRVVVVEREQHPGGAGLNTGTVPSKSLREAILDLTRFHERSFYGRELVVPEVSLSDLNFRLNRVLDEERRILLRQFRKNGIQLVHGFAEFADEHSLIVRDRDGTTICRVVAQHLIIAVGSKPRNPLNVPFDDEVILDSTRLLSIEKLPESLLVLGGGIVGSEYASFFAALGTPVTVVDKREHMLPLLDSEIGIHLQTALSDIGLKFLAYKIPTKIERVGNRAHVEFEDGTEIYGDKLLYALGRVAAIDGLGTEKLGIQLTRRGDIEVNGLFQTALPHIYAVGDVIGGPALASTAMEQGRKAVRHLCGLSSDHFPSLYPIGIYTIPEISTVGYTEDQLQTMGFHYEVGRAYYYEIARGQIVGSQSGMFKIIFHNETLEILGVHIIGRTATELIHVGQIAMACGARVDTFVNQVMNYPTFAEGYRIAALNGLNKIPHFR